MSRKVKTSYEDRIGEVPEDTKVYAVTPEDFTDKKFDEAAHYTIELRESYVVNRLYNGLKKDMKGEQVSNYAVDRLLSLACHLYDSSKGSDTNFLSEYIPKGGSSLNAKFLQKISAAKKSSQTSTSSTLVDVSEVKAVKDLEIQISTLESELAALEIELSTIAAPPTTGEDTNKGARDVAAKKVADKRTEIENKKAEKATAEATARSTLDSANKSLFSPIEQREVEVDDDNVVNEAVKKFGPFAAAYLFRLLVKTETNVINSWAHMRDMFKKFYGHDAPDFPVPTQKFLISLRDEINKDRKAAITWVKIVAEADMKLDPGVSEAGIVRYLGVLPLAYAGMHAYKLFIEARLLTRKTNQQLLLGLKSPETRDGCLSIADILINHESTSKVKKSGKFRFARLLGPQYFQSLQTKNCPELVYCLVEIVGAIRTSNEQQNPGNIAGLDRLSDSVKRTMARAAEKIVRNISKSSAKEYSPEMLAAHLDESDSDSDTESEESIPTKGRSMFEQRESRTRSPKS